MPQLDYNLLKNTDQEEGCIILFYDKAVPNMKVHLLLLSRWTTTCRTPFTRERAERESGRPGHLLAPSAHFSHLAEQKLG